MYVPLKIQIIKNTTFVNSFKFVDKNVRGLGKIAIVDMQFRDIMLTNR
jgi:hypothetical protein